MTATPCVDDSRKTVCPEERVVRQGATAGDEIARDKSFALAVDDLPDERAGKRAADGDRGAVARRIHPASHGGVQRALEHADEDRIRPGLWNREKNQVEVGAFRFALRSRLQHDAAVSVHADLPGSGCGQAERAQLSRPRNISAHVLSSALRTGSSSPGPVVTSAR